MQNLCRQVTGELVPSVPIKPISHSFELRSAYGDRFCPPGTITSTAVAEITTPLTSTHSISSSFLIGTGSANTEISENVPAIQVPRKICLTELETAC